MIVRHKLLFLIGMLCVFIGCGHKSPPTPQSEAPPNQSATAETIQEKSDKTVTAKGYGAIIDNDIPRARDEALMDAYNKAIEQGLGVRVSGKTVVKRFNEIKRTIITERKGYVKSYQILSENPQSDIGFEVTIEAVVSQNPISELDDLKDLIRFMGNPRLMLFVESEDKNSSIIEGHIITVLKKVGYRFIDVQQIEKLKERDLREKALLGDWEAAAILGNRLEADLLIEGNVSAKVTNKIEGKFPIIFATAEGSFKVTSTETAEIIYNVIDKDIPEKNRRGRGGADDKAIEEAVDKFITEIENKLIWELPGKIGLIMVQLRVLDCAYEQAELLTRLIKNLRIVENADLQGYQKPIAEINVEIAGKTRNLATHLQKLQDVNIEIKQLGLGSIDIKILE